MLGEQVKPRNDRTIGFISRYREILSSKQTQIRKNVQLDWAEIPSVKAHAFYDKMNLSNISYVDGDFEKMYKLEKMPLNLYFSTLVALKNYKDEIERQREKQNKKNGTV